MINKHAKTIRAIKVSSVAPKNKHKYNINTHDQEVESTINCLPMVCAVNAGNFKCICCICKVDRNTIKIAKHAPYGGLINVTEYGNVRILRTQLLQIESLNIFINKTKESKFIRVSRLLLNIHKQCNELLKFCLLLTFLNHTSCDVGKGNIIFKHIELSNDTKIAKTLLGYIKK